MDEDNGDPVPPLKFDRRNKNDLKRLAQTFADLKADRRDIQKIIRRARQAAQPERRKTVGKGARPKHAKPLPIRGIPNQTDDFNFLEELTQTKISVPIISIIRGMPSAHWDLQQALKMKNKSDDTRANLLKIGTEYVFRSNEVRAPMLQYLEMTLNNHHIIYAMADTGSTINLIPPALVEEFGFPTGKIEEPWNVKLANGTTQPVTQFATNFFNRDHVPSRRDKGVEVVPAPHKVPKETNRRVRFEGDSDTIFSEDEEDNYFRKDNRDVMLIKEAMKAKKGKVQRQGLYPASLTTPRHY
ncbi:hypothetical protein MCOR02_004655 [Pyricularia oryzae]|nr:hypothetical protein MCOR02_004655 [Pyricularia oryzae]